MFMHTPQPWTAGPGAPGPIQLRSSPLGTDKDQVMLAFPCQFGPDFSYDMSKSTTVAAGSSTPLSFNGSAIHGSGSCQVSLSKKASSNPKDWKVIHSMVGGCPGTALGNLQDLADPTKKELPRGKECQSADTDEIDCVKKYNVPIPKEIASGKYFFAWTWFNKIGFREMYMQCAPVEITGGSNSEDFLNAQPSIFYANYNGQPCSTTELYSLDFPAPGNSVLSSKNPLDTVSDLALGACAAFNPAQQAPPANVAYLLPFATNNATTPISSNNAPSIITTAAVTTSPGVFAPGASSASPAPAASVPTAPIAPVPAAPGVPAAGCANPCPEDGKVICLPPNNFGMCDHGCAVTQALAAGTKCENGAIIGLTGKRSIKKLSHVAKPRYAVAKEFAA
jgi:hypothetical protein